MPALPKGSKAMITILTGSNSYLLQSELKKLVDAFVAEHGDLAVEKLDSEDLTKEKLSESLQSLPFLASKKLVIVRELGKNKTLAAEAEQIFDDLPETTDLVLYELKPDKRSSYYKFLKKQKGFKEFNELDGPALSRWLVQQAQSQEGNLAISDAQYLVERVGANQMLLANEIDKLISYDPKITRETIDLLCEPTPQSTVFQLLESAFAGNAKKAMELYEDQRRQKVEPLAIMAMLAWQLHALAIVKTAGERDANTIASEAGLNPYVVRKTQGIARKISLAELKELISQAAKLDVRLKSESIDPDEALKNLLLQISRH